MGNTVAENYISFDSCGVNDHRAARSNRRPLYAARAFCLS
jgi:hypothetical protein